jgi:hypothetical protein
MMAAMNLPWRRRQPEQPRPPERLLASLISSARDDGTFTAEYLVMGSPVVTVPEGCTGARIRTAPMWPDDYPYAEEPGFGSGGSGGGTHLEPGAVTLKPGQVFTGMVGSSRRVGGSSGAATSR